MDCPKWSKDEGKYVFEQSRDFIPDDRIMSITKAIHRLEHKVDFDVFDVVVNVSQLDFTKSEIRIDDLIRVISILKRNHVFVDNLILKLSSWSNTLVLIKSE